MLRVKHWLKFKYKFRYEFERFFYFYVQASKTNSLLLLSRLQNPLLNPISIEALEIHLSGAPWGMGQNPLVVTIFGEEKNLHFLQLIYSTLLGARILIHIHIKHVQKKTSGNISNCIFPHGWSHSPTLSSQKDTQHGAMAYHHVRIIVLLQIVGQIWRRTQIQCFW